MNYHPLNTDAIKAIHALRQLNWSIRKIARAFEISRKTAAKTLAQPSVAKEPLKDASNRCLFSLDSEESHTSQCLHCGRSFTPDLRQKNRQKYCSNAACKAASKRASQEKWRAWNPNY